MGVSWTVRLEPLPPKRMFASGRSAGFDDVPERVRPAEPESTSPTKNGIAPEVVSSLILRLPKLLKPGGSFTGLTVTEKERAVCAKPSVRVTVMVPVPQTLLAVTKRRVPAEAGLV